MEAHGVSRTVCASDFPFAGAGQVEPATASALSYSIRRAPAVFASTRPLSSPCLTCWRFSNYAQLEVESAALRATSQPEQLGHARRLDALNDSVSHASDAVASDFAFHLEIALSTGNRYFTDIMTHLGTSIIPRTRLNSARLAHDDQQHYMSRLSREHEEIYEAIARQDSDAARAAMRLHLTNSRERLRQAHEEAQAQRG